MRGKGRSKELEVILKTKLQHPGYCYSSTDPILSSSEESVAFFLLGVVTKNHFISHQSLEVISLPFSCNNISFQSPR